MEKMICTMAIRKIMMRQFNYSFFLSRLLALFMLFSSSYALQTEFRQWNQIFINKPINHQLPWRYIVDLQLRFQDNEYKFNQFLALTAIGYQLNPNTAVFIGPGYVLNRLQNGSYFQEYRIWQQLNLAAYPDSGIMLFSRTRLEERSNQDFGQINYRLRQRFEIRIPLAFSKSYFIYAHNEFFFDLNHPSWVSPCFFSQNRAYIGIDKYFSKTTIFSMGYMNQYLFNKQNSMANVLFIGLSMF
jgi:hypothetical protein